MDSQGLRHEDKYGDGGKNEEIVGCCWHRELLDDGGSTKETANGGRKREVSGCHVKTVVETPGA